MKRTISLPLWFENAAAILLALGLSTAATVGFFQVDAEWRLQRVNQEILFDRVADAASTVEKAPAALRPELIETFMRPTRHLSLDADAKVGVKDARDATAEAKIAASVAPDPPREIRVHLVQAEEAQRIDGVFPPQPTTDGATVGPISMIISIRAGEAGWINVWYRAANPPLRYWPALLSGLVAVAVVLIATFWTSARFAQPLQRLAAAATALRRGEPVQPIPEQGPGAVRAAAQSFNAMSQRLTATLENQRAIMTAVAHDLRTPIASMRLRAEFVADEEERNRLLQTLDEMQSMTEAVLSAARADRTGEAARPVDLEALAESLVDDMTEIGGEVSFEPGASAVRCVCRTNEVRRALRNLIENAMRYGKRARVSIVTEAENAVIRVDDDGPGIPVTDLDRVFEPFARLESSRSAQTGGYGLGLSIARWIARGHGGDVKLANRQAGGLRATLMLPLAG